MESQILKPVEAQVDERINSKNEVQPDIKVQESVIVQDATTKSEVANTPEKPTIAQEAKKISPIAATKKAPVKKSSTKKASLKTSSTKKAMTVIKISCYKGKSVIVISSTKPLCPTGYSQK
jgi:purine-nucleoside phosphorylase